ncbi:uncharacterized protein MYCFIDRAFT_82999 [Pseudocercospora fijiensis CIRAD86]|uniref:Uncharacterized protein n=1 Tax=Pseudocercospora fijiensis (strain CIRAD86) TaxID=383855 RepID=M2Z557_PSEFD|nr:uncharacterized protein MYCFIDRAFT_82999 [Pseudocercospora fijiensis CIRAD86]EME84945.1 hypothetical protein MYCFIDRAFT_82999 [Pseudocercospora fijiensis CIRAD86]
MAFRNTSRDDVTMSGGALHNASQGLLRMTGGWGNVSGPGLFMVRTIFTGTLSAVTMGIVGASCGAIVWGTATLPFLVCSCSGFIFGALVITFDEAGYRRACWFAHGSQLSQRSMRLEKFESAA